MDSSELTKNIKLSNFYKNMINPPKKEKGTVLYGYSSKGDLVATTRDGTVVSSIPLNYYRSYTVDEISALEAKRRENIISIETQIDIEHGLLRKAYSDFKLTGDALGVVTINQRIHELELKKLYYRSPVLTSVTLQAPEIRSIFFDQPYDERKYDDVLRVVRKNHELKDMYGKYTGVKEYGTVEESDIQLDTKTQVLLKTGRVARLFNDLDGANPYLSIFNISDFVWNGVEYSSPYQAFEYTRLKENGYDQKADGILKIRSPKTVRAVVSRIPGVVKDIENVWIDIFKSYYTYNESMYSKLLSTNTDTLVFTNDIPYLGGVGVLSEDTKLWKYPNSVGNALMALRSSNLSGGSVIDDTAVREKSSADKRKGAIISAKRSLKGVGF